MLHKVWSGNNKFNIGCDLGITALQKGLFVIVTSSTLGWVTSITKHGLTLLIMKKNEV